MSALGIVLKKLRESRGLTIIQLSEKAKIGKGTIGDIETGKNKSTIKTLEKISEGLNLKKEERELLFSAFIPKDLGNKLIKKEKLQLNDLINSVNLFYNDRTISEEDKKKLHDSLQELFFDAKIRNKKRDSK